MPNAVRQNAAHMHALRRVIDDASVALRGYVVSAGAGRFAPQLARAIVPAAELRTRLAGDAALQRRGGVKLEAAWSRLVAAAAEGETHRAAHATRPPGRCGRPHAAVVLTSAGDKAGSPTPSSWDSLRRSQERGAASRRAARRSKRSDRRGAGAVGARGCAAAGCVRPLWRLGVGAPGGGADRATSHPSPRGQELGGARGGLRLLSRSR